MFKRIQIFTFIFFLCQISWSSVDVSSRFLTMNDGLSSNSVLSIIQDNKGFMWIGTSNGLNRYDGYNFVSYFPEKGKISLIDNRIKKN